MEAWFHYCLYLKVKCSLFVFLSIYIHARVTESGLWWFCCVTLVKLEVTFSKDIFRVWFQVIVGQKRNSVKFRRQKSDSSLYSLMVILLSNVITDGRRGVQQFPAGTYSLLLHVQLFFPTLGPADTPQMFGWGPPDMAAASHISRRELPLSSPFSSSTCLTSQNNQLVMPSLTLQLSAASPRMQGLFFHNKSFIP